ncbi:MAG: hypothetical protein EXR92_05090 [Gemmatimonadetes bacterium]|nr:hypothetical protein [Gemmatimonadota bacterium]
MILLARQGAAPSDTVVAIASRDAVDWLVAAASGSIVLWTILLFLALGFVVFQARRAQRGIEEMTRKLSMDPAMGSLRRTAENMSAISEAVRGEIERFSESVGHVSEQLTHASRRIEERVEQFNALMEVVQREAEGTFVDGAATARGIRAGLGAFRGGRRRPSETEPGDGTPDRGHEPLPNAEGHVQSGDAFPDDFGESDGEDTRSEEKA